MWPWAEEGKMGFVVLGGLILIVPFWYIWEWWTEGTLAGTEAIALSALFLVVFGQMAAIESLRPVLFLLLLATAVIFPFLSQTLEKVADSKLKAEKIQNYRQTLTSDPTNTGARMMLAKTLYSMGQLDEAIAEVEAGQGVARLGFEDEKTLTDWKEERRLRDIKEFLCETCGKQNERGSVTCVACGRALPRSRAAQWMRSGGPAAAARAWALAVACIAGLLLVSALIPQLGFIPPHVVMVMGFAAWLGFYLLRRRGNRA